MNTRINPTLNGRPHLGHAYLALVNQHEAHASGGRFILRGEDNQASWLKVHTLQEMQSWGREWVRDLAWLGIAPDEVAMESALDDGAWRAVHAHWPRARDTGEFPHVPRVVGDTAEHYPYTLALTAKVACLDYMQCVGHVIVGHDLLSRYSLYCYCCEVMGIPVPPQTFLPRLVYDDGRQIGPVSKHGGALRICDLRDAGRSPDWVMGILRAACLADPSGPWSPGNIRPRPAILEAWL